MAKAKSTAVPFNPLIDNDSPADTIDNVRSVLAYLESTVYDQTTNGINKKANYGIALMISAANAALQFAESGVRNV